MQNFSEGKKGLGFHVQFVCEINGILTNVVAHQFTNKCLVLITQYGGLPNLYTVQFDVSNEHQKRVTPLNVPNYHMSVPVTMKCLLGADKAEIRAGIQFLINRTKLNSFQNEILITLGLREIESHVLYQIADILEKEI